MVKEKKKGLLVRDTNEWGENVQKLNMDLMDKLHGFGDKLGWIDYVTNALLLVFVLLFWWIGFSTLAFVMGFLLFANLLSSGLKRFERWNKKRKRTRLRLK